MLSLTSDEFIAQAALLGVKSPQALDIYRQGFRQDVSGVEWAFINSLPIVAAHVENGTIKFIQRHPEGLETESVILPITSLQGRRRHTLCVSSQVGCAMGCTFCETAQMGLMKNLTAAQIVGQWHAAQFRTFAEEMLRDSMNQPRPGPRMARLAKTAIHDSQPGRITNIVFMGMGEPMDNLDAVIQAIRIFTDPNGPAIPPARITVSTVGRIEGILGLAEFARKPGHHKLRLAVSINAPNDAIRSPIMPINRSTPMRVLMEAMRQWPANPKSRVLIEYVLIPGVNDHADHARELCEFLRPLCCTVNVIPYNPRRQSPWPAPSEESVRRFVQTVHECGQFVKRRQTMGRSVMAACGQLGNPAIRARKVIEQAQGVR